MRQLHADGRLSGPAAELMQPQPYEVLYDTDSDPREIRNLVNSNLSQHQEALVELREALDAWEVETGDLGEFLEPPEVVEPFVQEMHDWFGTPVWYDSKSRE